MAGRKYMRTRQLKPGMKIDQVIEDRMGRNLVVCGSILDDYIIESLLKLGIMSVYIQDGDDTPEDNILSPAAAQKDEQLRTSDPSKVTLSDSVKKRVSEGIQFVYNNTGSDKFVEAVDSITEDLMHAITQNNAIAIDISSLKTSDEYTFKHSVDVATISMILAKHLNMSKQEIYEIGITGLLHDIGKTQIPPDILNKPGQLDDAEFDIMKRHALYGYRMLNSRNEFNNAICLGVLQHHEKVNGAGYPLGFESNQICPYAKILSVADIYDALVTERPYKAAYTQREAVEMIMSMTGELDITAMKAFLESMILYPVDSIVELSNGEKARVVKNNFHYILRPTVVGIKSGKVYDLRNDLNCANIIINN